MLMLLKYEKRTPSTVTFTVLVDKHPCFYSMFILPHHDHTVLRHYLNLTFHSADTFIKNKKSWGELEPLPGPL